VHLNPRESRTVQIEVDARAMSAVDANGARSVLPGNYRLSLGPGQPSGSRRTATARFTVRGTRLLDQ
jgi:beta-glucosidase